jgi:uncharacterized protein (DUF58 family)
MHLLPLIAFILLIGLVSGASLFAVGACSLLLVFQLARGFSMRWADSLEAERSITGREMEIGQTVTVGLKLRNRSSSFVPWLFAEDLLPKQATSEPHQALAVQGALARLTFFAPKQTSLMTYQLKSLRRGYFQIGPTVLETGDLLGLHRSYRIATKPEFLTVLPKLVALDGVNVTSRRPMGELRVNDRVMEDPTQMVGIRQYRAGDPLNRIHWRATARTGALHTRVFEPTCMQGAMLVVDLHHRSNPIKNEPVRCDLAVTAAASLAHTLFTMNQPFGLISNGRDAIDRVRSSDLLQSFRDRASVRQDSQMRTKDDRLRPVVLNANRGPEHFQELHHTLARLERTDGLMLPDLLMETQSRLPRSLSVLVVLQTADETTALALSMLRRQGYSVSVILNQHQLDVYLDTASKLVAYHIPVFHLDAEDSIATVCRDALL